MALPSSGELSLSEIATEYSVTQSNVSLATMSTDISLTAPHAVSEFYGRSAGPGYTPLGYTVVSQPGSLEPWKIYYNNNRWHITGAENQTEYDISDNNASSFSQGVNYLLLNASLAFNGNTVCSIDLSNNNKDFRIGRSTNNGTSWSQILNLGNENFTSFRQGTQMFYHGSNRWIAFSNADHYISTDNGASFSRSNTGISIGYYGGGAQSGSRIIINDDNNFYLSDNGFSTYTTISLPFVSGSKYKPNNIATDGSGTWLAWKWLPGGKMLKSTNNGSSWSAISTDLPSYLNGISFKYNNGTYGDGAFHIAASEYSGASMIGGVFSSTNDGSNFNLNPLAGPFYGSKGANAVHHNGSDMVAGNRIDYFKFN
jgi:hypothetical protein